MTGRPIWYELVTPDPAGAKAFYDAVVGWTIAGEAQFPNGYRMIARADGGNAGGLLPLTEAMMDHGARPIWLAYYHVDDVDGVAAAMAADGAVVHMPPFDIPGVGRVAMIADPVGPPFYLMTPIPPPGREDAVSDVFDPDRPQHVRWNELATSDQDGAIAFFARHLGWVQDGAMPMGEMGDYKFVHADDVAIGAIMPKPAQSPLSAWTHYIGVDDIDRAAQAVTQGGGTLLHGPMEVPGGDHALAALDPQGAMFGLVGPRHEGASQ